MDPRRSRRPSFALIGAVTVSAIGVVSVVSGCDAILDISDHGLADGGQALDGSGPSDASAPRDAPVDAMGSCPSENVCSPDFGAAWTGPVSLFRGAGTPPACSGAYPRDLLSGHSGLIGGAGHCSDCDCGAAVDAGCSDLEVSIYDGDSCTGTPCVQFDFGSGDVCVPIPSACSGTLLVDSVPPHSTGSCPASGGVPTNPTPTWSMNGVACGLPGPSAESCSGGNCVPAPPAGSSLCVYRSGDVTSCPSGYAKRLVLYGGVDDTRGCTACSCDFEGVCSGFAAQEIDSTCTMGLGAVMSGSCTVVAAGTSAIVGIGPTLDSSCKPQGGQPTGSLKESNPTTLCCLGE